MRRWARFILLLRLGTSLAAGVIHVPADYPDIQTAINAAVSGDEIILAQGVYGGIGNNQLDPAGKAIIIRGEDPNDLSVTSETIIDCHGSAMDPRRAFYFHSGEDNATCIKGITIINGYRSSTAEPNQAGGAILIDGARPAILNCIFRSNFAYFGGALAALNGAAPVISNCQFEGNDAGQGGALYFSQAAAAVVSCQLIGNTAGAGAGVYGRADQSRFNNCLFYGNSATQTGGGIMLTENSNYILDRNTFFANLAGQKGGALLCQGAQGELSNSIFWNNPSPGGALSFQTGTGESLLRISYCDLPPAIAEPNSCHVQWGSGNFYADPLLADPNHGDFHLRSNGWRWWPSRAIWTWDDVTSPGVDAGNPGASLAQELTAIADDPENQYGRNLRLDLGCYAGTAEASLAPLAGRKLADINNDGFVNFIDWGILAGNAIWPIPYPGDLSRDGRVDYLDLTRMAEEWLAR